MNEDEAQYARERRERISLIHRTHDIFCGIYGKNISLRSDGPIGHTDVKTFVSVPMEHVLADLVHKHEWQHLFMGSDLHARLKFVNEYADNIIDVSPGIPGLHIQSFLHQFVNALEDLRVNDLWKRIYPQSAEDIEKWWRNIILTRPGMERDLITYSMAIGLGLKDDVAHSEWAPHADIIEEGLHRLYGYGPPAPMVAAKYILDHILERAKNAPTGGPPSPVYVQPPPPTGYTPPGQHRIGAPAVRRPSTSKSSQSASAASQTPEKQAVEKLVTGMEKSKALESFQDTTRSPVQGEDPNHQHNASMVESIMEAQTDEDSQRILNASIADVEKAVQALLGRTRRVTTDEKLLKGIESKTRFLDIKGGAVEQSQGIEGERWAVERLRASFAKLMDRKRHRLSDTGSIVDVAAYIDFLTKNGDGDVFEDERTSKGFSAMVLLDMSGSMADYWEILSAACRTLSKALRMPFSKFEVWGFTGTTEGVVHIFRFLEPEKGIVLLDNEDAWRLTPLHIAAEVAIRRLQQYSGSTQHLFIITDGAPSHISAKGHSINPIKLVGEVSQVVARGSAKGINTLSLVIGDGVDDLIADVMFGSRKWARVREVDSLFGSLIELVQGAFVSYLRKR